MHKQLSQAQKTRIARQFSRAAGQYNEAAQIQLQVAMDALSFLPEHVGISLDIGCGTGRITRMLAARSSTTYAIDLAMGMLHYAKTESVSPPDPDGVITWLQADAEQLPLQQHSVHTVFSSMVLQWCAQPDLVMQQIRGVLKPGGQAVLAIMVDNSFFELNSVWAHFDQIRHINKFHRAETWRQAALNSGLKVELQRQRYTSYHLGLRELLTSIKQVGANVLLHANETNTQSAQPLSRSLLRQLEAEYRHQYATFNALPLSYELVFLHCQHSDS
jgi:malonyl-CoA O-methyltransferase